MPWAALAAGLGISIVNRHTLVHMAPGNLVELDVVGFPIAHSWYLVHWQGRALSPVAKAFKRQMEAGREPAPKPKRAK